MCAFRWSDISRTVKGAAGFTAFQRAFRRTSHPRSMPAARTGKVLYLEASKNKIQLTDDFLDGTRDGTGRDGTGTGRDGTGRDGAGLGWAGLDRTGQDRTGQDRTGQDRTGQDLTGQAGQGRQGKARQGMVWRGDE